MKEYKITENDITKVSLKIVNDNPGINTTQLIKKLEKIVELNEEDKKLLDNRKDTKFSQIVRNLTGSHLKTNEFGKCVEYDKKIKRNKKFYINEMGKKIIEEYEVNKWNEEKDDNNLQREIRECSIYNTKIELEKANTRIPEKNFSSYSTKYKVDARISKTVLKENDYVCEIEKLTGEKHKTFNTTRGIQYMEGHHLIPMKAQKDFNENIDRSNNICCLCPNCHRAIHYGSIEEKSKRLKLLYYKKIKNLIKDGIEIDFDELINKFYL